jgi:DNA-directed RNA polymerase subunit M/transcription elongation factor TFIIS
MSGVWMYFHCSDCNAIRKTKIQIEKLTVCSKCGNKQTVTRNDRIVGMNNNITNKPYTERKRNSKGQFY